MKIGIQTFWWGPDNYGEQLQLYALQKFLKKKGHDAYLIRYYMPNDLPKEKLNIGKIYKAFNPYKLIKFINRQLIGKKSVQQNTLNPRYFELFREKFINMSPIYSNYRELKTNPPEADVYIAGSDQIWNPDCAMNNITTCSDIVRGYFLDFGGDNIRRISYAASFGQKSISDEWRDFISPLLNKFYWVSVREKSGVSISKKCMNVETSNSPVWVCDPTLLLDAEDYRDLYNNGFQMDNKTPLNVINHEQEDYIVFYYVNNGGKFNINSVYEFARKNNLKVYYISANGQIDKFQKVYPNLLQWLELVDHAKYVITNSFHCCVFSIIFHKQFAAIPITGAASGMNERLTSLFEICKIQPRILNVDFSILNEKYESNVDNSGGELLLNILEKFREEIK